MEELLLHLWDSEIVGLPGGCVTHFVYLFDWLTCNLSFINRLHTITAKAVRNKWASKLYSLSSNFAGFNLHVSCQIHPDTGYAVWHSGEEVPKYIHSSSVLTNLRYLYLTCSIRSFILLLHHISGGKLYIWLTVSNPRRISRLCSSAFRWLFWFWFRLISLVASRSRQLFSA